MDNTTEDNMDEIEDNDEETNLPKRSAGRPKGSKTGPRPTLWVCAGIVDGKIAIDAFSAPLNSSDEKKLSFSQEEAEVMFRAKYKLATDDEVVTYKRSFHEKKGGYTCKNTRKLEIIPASTTDYEVGNRRAIEAIFNGWKGTVHEIQVSISLDLFKAKYGVPAEDCCFFWPMESISSPGKKKTPPAPSLILTKALESIESDP